MKKIYYLILSAVLITSLPQALLAQKLLKKDIKADFMKAKDPIICYFTTEDMNTVVPLSAELEQLIAGRTDGSEGAEIIVDYINFNPEQQVAFQHAVDIWAGLLNSNVPIRIQVTMTSALGQGTLASANTSAFYRNLDNFQKIDSWYVMALAEKVFGEPLNEPEEPDIVMRFNAGINWYTDIDKNTGSGQYDFVTVALHEIGHGLGFYSLSSVVDDQGSYVISLPTPYGRNLENGSGENIHDVYSTNPTLFGTQLTSENLFFRSFAFNDSSQPKIYAPFDYNGGSSISHLDEDEYKAGDVNSLMTPQIGPSESNHNPGLALDMLKDIGWISMDMDHASLLDSEDEISDRSIVATVEGDNAVITDGVKLHYTYSDWSNEVVVPMASTGTLNEYSADIPAIGKEAVVSYYIEVEDTDGRVFTKPGEAPEYFLQYNVGPDISSPEITHTPVLVVLVDDPIVDIAATVDDNIGAGPLTMTYRINGGPEAEIEIPIISQDNNGKYSAEHFLDWDLSSFGLKDGDLLEYQLSVTDLSNAGNTTNSPRGETLYEVRVEALAPPQTFYATDFSAAANDFSGEGFSIQTPMGFDNAALHSTHPYRVGEGVDNNDTLQLQETLKVPIILSERNATIRFDEVVLVEPGEAGAGFGSDEFWDYVVVEGSADFGATWFAFEPGYDSRADAAWLAAYNSDLETITVGELTYQDSKAEGNSTLYRPREIDMLKSGNFIPGQQVLIRFKLYADQLVAGWGWAIDNLKIQVDDEAPVISHVPINYAFEGDNQLAIVAKVTDNSILDSVTYEVNIDGQTELINFDAEVDIYELSLNLSSVSESTSIKYRIIAVDSALIPNTTFLPATGFFEIPVAVLGDVKDMYVNDFNAATNDFISSNYDVTEYDGFTDNALHSRHPYPNSPTGIVAMSTLLKYPIKLSGSKSWMSYKEVGLVDILSDALTVEVSNDNGVNWYKAVPLYGANSKDSWRTAFFPKDSEGNSTGVGTSNLYIERLFDLQSPEEINTGDEVLVRFTMLLNDITYGWGWVIDDVEIQGPTTAIDEESLTKLSVYPNPTQDGRVLVEGKFSGRNPIISVTDFSGKLVAQDDVIINNDYINKRLDLGTLRKGVYLITVRSSDQVFTARVIVD